MPRTDITVEEASRTTPLQDPTQHTPDVANGNSFNNSSQRVIMYITNGSAGNAVCTVDIPGTYEGEAIPNKVYTVPAGERWVIGPFPSDYNQTDNGLTKRVLFNFDVSADITVDIFKATI